MRPMEKEGCEEWVERASQILSEGRLACWRALTGTGSDYILAQSPADFELLLSSSPESNDDARARRSFSEGADILACDAMPCSTFSHEQMAPPLHEVQHAFQSPLLRGATGELLEGPWTGPLSQPSTVEGSPSPLMRKLPLAERISDRMRSPKMARADSTWDKENSVNGAACSHSLLFW